MRANKKTVAVICVLCLTVFLVMLTACGGDSASSGGTPEDNTGTETNSIRDDTASKTRTYIIVTDTVFAPFEFQSASGEFVGVDMELLAAIAEDQGFAYTVDPVGFDAALQAVTSGQADGVIAGMSITDKRREILDFSQPYFDSGVVMGVSAEDDTIKGYEDLAGKRVAVKTSTEGEDFAESIKAQYGFETVSFKDSSMVYEDVIAGNSQACFEDYPVLGYAISQNVGLEIVTEMERGSSYGFAVQKGQNAELLKMFNDGLANLKANGTYQEILDRYFPK